MTDAKETWDAIKSRFGGNDEFKKMQKYILKQQFEGFSVSNSEGLHKGYDSCPQLDHEDLEQIDEYDLEEMDLKWQVAMISMRMKKFYKKTSRKLQFDAKEPVGFDKTKNSGTKDGSRTGKNKDSKALVTIDGKGVDWKNHSEDDEDYALMACNSSDSDTESVFMNKESELEKQHLYDRFVVAEGMHAVPPLMTGNYMPSGPDIEVDYSQFTYGPIQTHPCDFKSLTSVFDELSASDAPIIVEYESDSEMSRCQYHKRTETASFANLQDYPHRALKNKGIVDSGCSRNMTGNKAYLAEFQDFNGGPVAFGGSKGYITGKGKIKTGGLACFIAKATTDDITNYGIGYIRPFGYHVTILNTIDHLGKFAGKSDEGFLVGYSLQSKAFRVYNLETKRVEENLHITFLENKLNVTGKGPTWLFDLDYLADFMNYHPVRSEYQANLHAGQQEANHNAGTEDIIDAGDSEKEDESAQDCFVLPIWPSYSSTITPDLKTDEKREGPREEEQVFLDELERLKRQEKEANEEAEALRKEYAQETENLVIQAGAAKASSTNIFSTVSTPAKASSTNLVNTVSIPVSTASPHEGLSLSDPTNPEQDDSEIPPLEDIYQNSTDGIFTNSSYDDEGAVADFTNLETIVNVSPIPTSRIISSHPSALILGDPTSAVQTKEQSKLKVLELIAFKISEALEDESWVDAMQEELLQFEIQKVWILVDLPFGKKAIGTKWVYRNKKDERGVVVRNKARLVAQGHRQEEGIDYDEVFALVVRIEAIRIFLAFALYMGFIVYQMDVKSAFLYGKIDEEVYVSQPPGFLDPKYPQKVYKVVKALYGLHQAPRAWLRMLVQPIETKMPLVKDEKLSVLVLGDSFLGNAKSQSIVANFTTEAEYVVAASCCGQVLWIQNQMLDYGFNFMNTKIYIDNESTICIVKNPVYHSKTKHIAIRHHFIRDAYEKKLIQVLKIHTDDNVADLLTKAFDVSRGLIGFRESLRRVIDGTEALLIPTLFILWLDTVSTDSAKLVPLGKVCTAIETLKKNTAKALISLLTTITLSTTMAVLDSCPKHNMVAYLEKSEGNAEFHEIIDFLTRSSIHHALTVSPVVSTTFVEQFWELLSTKIFKMLGTLMQSSLKPRVSISEASIRSDLLFYDANRIDSLPNQAIFDAIQLMGSKSTSWDQIPTNIATTVICLTSNQKYNFSKLIFDESSGGNLGGHSSSDKSLSGNEGEMTLQSVYDLCLSLCAQQRLEEKRSSKKQWVHKESVSKQGRKFAKGEPSVQRDPLFDEIPEDTLDHMETENAQDVGRTRDIVGEEKENDENILSTNKEKDLAYLTKSLLTLKPLLKIDPKDKGKKKIEEEDESESESDGIPEAEKKFKQLEIDEEMARKNTRKSWKDCLLRASRKEMRAIHNRIKSKFHHDTIDAIRKIPLGSSNKRSEAIEQTTYKNQPKKSNDELLEA
ncbi:putative ribonuclease H-like domain-containing protein [Tanacetum coccineum]|uniref:Ribonuclease H-like domain-containing protein n=1 Tax=Tanacetum coccineum TaxID=301880 RepID=A0ABQ5DMV1_9ASTR